MVQSNTSGPLRFVHRITAWCIFCCSFATPPRSPALSLLCSFEFFYPFLVFPHIMLGKTPLRSRVAYSLEDYENNIYDFVVYVGLRFFSVSLRLSFSETVTRCTFIMIFLFRECVIHFLARFDLSLWTKRCRSDAHMLDLLGRYKLNMTLLDEFRLQKSQSFEPHKKESGKG